MQSVRQYNAPHLANLVWFGRSIAAWLQIDDLSDTTSRQHMIARATHLPRVRGLRRGRDRDRRRQPGGADRL
jgi:hypothetical protein